jgi:predicted nucleic acid-binding protein
MAIYFADTSFWVAVVDNRDAYHSKSIEWTQKLSGTIVTTEAVLLETANTFSRPNWRSKVIGLIDHIQSRSDVEIVYKSWQLAWDLFTDRPDKAWSLTDCISFVVMQEKRVTDALTADIHFQQAGFRALLLETD